MDRTLPNKCTKFGAKMCRRYQVITFYVLGHFLAAPCTVAMQEETSFSPADRIFGSKTQRLRHHCTN